MEDRYKSRVEEGEDLFEAAIREAEEELKIKIERSELKIAHILHHYKGGSLKFTLRVNKYNGKIGIGEPDQCEELKWFKINELPENMIERVRKVIIEICKNVSYDNSDFINF